MVDKSLKAFELEFKQLLKMQDDLFGFLYNVQDLSKGTIRKGIADLEVTLTEIKPVLVGKTSIWYLKTSLCRLIHAL